MVDSRKNFKTLHDFLKYGSDWQVMETITPGIAIVRIPKSAHRPARLMVEIRPVNNLGERRKRKGIIIADLGVRDEFVALLSHPNLAVVFEQLHAVNPKLPAKELIDILKVD